MEVEKLFWDAGGSGTKEKARNKAGATYLSFSSASHHGSGSYEIYGVHFTTFLDSVPVTFGHLSYDEIPSK